jgi:hypothetical protein
MFERVGEEGKKGERNDNTITSLGRILLAKLTVIQPVKKLHAFYGTCMFITVLTTARQWSL